MTRMPVLRPLGRADLARLAALSAGFAAETVVDWARRLDRPGVVVIGAELGDTLIGYAAGEMRRSFGSAVAAAWIDAFGVDLAHRGHGVGRSLLTALLASLRDLGADHVFTLVPLHDRGVAPFFRELGFREEPLVPIGREL